MSDVVLTPCTECQQMFETTERELRRGRGKTCSRRCVVNRAGRARRCKAEGRPFREVPGWNVVRANRAMMSKRLGEAA